MLKALFYSRGIKRPPRIFYGWWIVLVSLIADGIKQGSFNRGFTVYIIPIQTDLGLGAAAIGWADTLGRLMGGLQGPVVGYCTDRFGPRTMLIFGGLASGLGFILLSQTENYFFFLLVFVGMLSVGFRSGYNNASIAAVNNWFRRRRGLAMSIVSMGDGLGGTIAPLVGLMVLTFGWRTSVLFSGIAIIVLIIPLSLLIKRSPETVGLLPDGDRPDSDQPGADQPNGEQNPADQQAGSATGNQTGNSPAGDQLKTGRWTLPPGKRCAPRPTGCWCWPPACGTRAIPGCLSCWPR